MSPQEPQRHLLFGLLAFQNRMIDRSQLLNAFSAWMADKSIGIDQWLIARKILTGPQRDVIQELADQHIEGFSADLSQSFAGENDETASLRRELEQLVATNSDAWHAKTMLPGNSESSEIKENAEVLSKPSGEQAFAETVHGPIDLTDDAQPHGTTDQQRFQIIREHAKGGLGVVFVANDTQLRREVALKQIRSDRPDTEAFREKFTLEAEVTGQLEHPGIVPVYALGTDANGRPYYAMRFIKGEDLKSRIKAFHDEGKAKPQPFDGVELRKLLRRLVDVCNAMSYAHERGVLHRDLKPANVMLGKHGETLVVDWGLAKPIGQKASDTEASFDATSSEVPLQPSGSGSGSETRYGTFIGTPAYAPPEQVLGQLDRMGPRSDVYSLGAMLYELLTGQTPVAGKSIDEIISKVIAGEIDRPCSVNASIPAALQAICLKAMSVKSEHRYATVDAFRMDLEGWLDDQPVSAYPEPLVVRARRWTRNHPAMTTGISATTVLGLLAAIAFSIISAAHNTALVAKNDTISQQSQQLQKTSDDLKITNEQILQQSKEFRLRTARNYLHSGVIAFDNGKQDEGIQTLLSAYVLSKEDPELHESVTRIAYDRATLGGRRLLPQIVQDSPARSMAYSGDGRLLFTGAEDGVVRIYDAMTTRMSNSSRPIVVGASGNDLQVEPNLDGSRILFASTVWDVNTGEYIVVEVPSGHQVRETHFNLDCKLVFGILEDQADPQKRTLCQWEAGDGAYSRKLGDLSGRGYLWFQILPNGQHLLFWNPYEWFIWDLNENQMSARGGAFLTPNPIYRLTVSPEGIRMSEGVRVVDVLSLNAIQEFSRDYNDADSTKPHAFRPDGRVLASIGSSVERMSYAVDARAFHACETPFLHSQPVSEIRFSPDGCVRSCLGAGNQLDLHEPTVWRPEILRQDSAQVADINHILFDASGQSYVLDSNTEARIFSRDSNTQSCPLIQHAFDPGVAFSPAGTRLHAGKAIWDAETGVLLSQTSPPEDNAYFLRPGFTDDQQTIVSVHSGFGRVLAFSQDSKLVLTQSEKSASIWDIKRHHRVFGPVPVVGDVRTAILRAELPFFVTGYVDGTVNIHYTDGSGRVLRLSNGRHVNEMDLSPDGTVLLTTSPRLNFWDTITGVPLFKSFAYPDERCDAFSFTPDGKEVYFSPGNGTLCIWDFEIPPAAKSAQVRQAFLELLTGYRVDDAGVTSRLSERDREERFVTIESEPEWWAQHLDFIKRKRIKWHRYQLSESIAENDHFGASFHLNQLRKKLQGDDEQLKTMVEPFQIQVDLLDLNQQVAAALKLAGESKFMDALAILDSLKEKFPQLPTENLLAADNLRTVVLLNMGTDDSLRLAGQSLLSPERFAPGTREWNQRFAVWLNKASTDEKTAALALLASLPDEKKPELKWLEGWIHSATGSHQAAIDCLSDFVGESRVDFMDLMFYCSSLKAMDQTASALLEHQAAMLDFNKTFGDATARSQFAWDQQWCVNELESFLSQQKPLPSTEDAAAVLKTTVDLMLRNRFSMAESELSQLAQQPDLSETSLRERQLLNALCKVHHMELNAGEDAVLDAFLTLLRQSELQPDDSVWQAIVADLLIHASSGELHLMRSKLDQWAAEHAFVENAHFAVARRWIEASLTSQPATIPEIDLNDPLHAASPISRYFAARHLRLKGDNAAADEQIAQAFALLNQGWLANNPSPSARFLQQQLRTRLELLRSVQTVGFTAVNGVNTLMLGGLVADSVRLEGTNADEKLVGWLSENSELAVLNGRKLFAVNSQSPEERREFHDFSDSPNFGDLTVSADGSFGWLGSNAVQRRRQGTTETKGSGFDPSYSDDGSAFVWSSWDKDGNYQFELDRGADHSAFTIPTHPTFSMYPSLSQNGRHVVFRSIGRDDTPQIRVLDTEKGITKQITDNGESNMKPCFSPDGRFVAFLQSHVSQHPSHGSIRLMVRDLQSGVETIVANDVQYVRGFWMPVAKD